MVAPINIRGTFVAVIISGISCGETIVSLRVLFFVFNSKSTFRSRHSNQTSGFRGTGYFRCGPSPRRVYKTKSFPPAHTRSKKKKYIYSRTPRAGERAVLFSKAYGKYQYLSKRTHFAVRRTRSRIHFIITPSRRRERNVNY